MQRRMKQQVVWVVILAGACSAIGEQPKAPVDYVNPFLYGVNERWFAFAPASLPFGLAKLAPMTSGPGDYVGGGGRTGYDYRDGSIIGFSHVHEWQLGGILIMPTVGDLVTVPGDAADVSTGYRSPFKKSSEKAGAGYYSVFLDRYNIGVDLTATKRVGFHRYTFPKSDSAHIIFDVGNLLGEAGTTPGGRKWGWDEAHDSEYYDVQGASVEILSPTRIQGYTIALPVYSCVSLEMKTCRVYFAATLSKPASSYGCYRKNTHHDKLRAEYGRRVGAYLNFKTHKDEQIEVRVGISFVSMDQAWANLEAEDTGKPFEQVRNDARTEWNRRLSKIEVEGGPEANKVKFYSALYMVLLGRGTSSDANGKYISNYNEVKQIPLKDGVPEYSHYNNDGLWGAFGNFLQVWSLVYPEQIDSYSKGMLDVYDETGWLPDGLACDKFLPGMNSNQMPTVLTCAVNRGVATFDIEKAYRACYKNETEYVDRPRGAGKYDLRDFWKYDYIPYGEHRRIAASHTLENAFSCWVTAQMAKKLNKTSDYERLMEGSRKWENLFDAEKGFLNARLKDGSFVRPFNPVKSPGFEEGNINQYAFFVPHDIQGIVNKMGKERSIDILDGFFTVAEKSNFSDLQIYFHGNQPPLLNAFVFNYIGQPWRTQKWVRAIMDKFYMSVPGPYKEYKGDDDQGQLGGWFVNAAIGLFDISGGCAVDQQLYIHTPLFAKVTIHLNKQYYKADKFTILTRNFSEKNIYIQSAELNGRKLDGLHFDFDEINAGSTLVLELGETPKK